MAADPLTGLLVVPAVVLLLILVLAAAAAWRIRTRSRELRERGGRAGPGRQPPPRPSPEPHAAAPDVTGPPLPRQGAAADLRFQSPPGLPPRRSRSIHAVDLDPPVPEASAPDLPRLGGSAFWQPPTVIVQAQATADSIAQTAAITVDCPAQVVVGREFELRVNLVMRSEAGQPPPLVTIHVVAEGFDLNAADAWRAPLTVHPLALAGRHAVRLTPQRRDAPREDTGIHTVVSAHGRTVGVDRRDVAVLARPEMIDPAVEGAARRDRLPGAVTLPPAAEDLSVTILRSRTPGVLLWTMDSRHAAGSTGRPMPWAAPALTLPAGHLEVSIGHEPADFVREMVAGMNRVSGGPLQDHRLLGFARTLGDKIPAEFWSALKDVAARTSSPPSVLFLSQEPHIPWELAAMTEPLDPAAPAILSAQARVGRWVVPERTRPVLPPPVQLHVHEMGVVSGDYSGTDWGRMPAAEEEAAALADAYGATPVDATPADVTRYLTRDAAQALHFAVHGSYEPRKAVDGLIMRTGDTLTAVDVRGFDLSKGPFVYLNACQVGSGREMLGTYAGMAESFLYAGASAVVAPLWSIGDDASKALALEFYRRLADGVPAAEVLRQARGAAAAAGGVASCTAFAFQYFGHPLLKVALPRPAP